MQNSAEKSVPKEDSNGKRKTVAHSQVAPAEPEAQIEPNLEQSHDKQQIPQPSGTAGAQEFIIESQGAAQKQPLPQMQPGAHPNRRCQNPAARGSS